MTEFNSFSSNSNEPYITVKPRHTILKIVLLLVITATLAAVFFYNKQWWQLEEIVTPVPSVAAPLSEGETDAYRETLEKTLLPESDSNTITVPASAVKEITESEVAAVTRPQRPITPPSNATKVAVAGLVPSDMSPTIQPNPYAPEAVYLEGDITITNFVVEQTTLQNDGAAVSVNGIVFVSDAILKNATVLINQEAFTVLFTDATIMTKDGRTLTQSTLKNGDIVAITGTQFNGSKTINASTIVLEGVVDYIP